MGLVREYTEEEVAAILKNSEGQGVEGEKGQGHSEHLHELVQVGKRREHTSEEGLIDRVYAERKKAVGAFDGCQVAVVTWALNCQAGQSALMYLNTREAKWVFAEIDVSTQLFRMKHVQADVPKVGPIQLPEVQSCNVSYVAMKLMKEKNSLHIRTAFPLSAAPACGHSHCVVTYEGVGDMDQDLSV